VQWLALGAIVIGAVVADQVTKHVVAANLSLGEALHVVGSFSIRHVQNSGIAFGLFSNATAAVIVVTAIAVAWMLVYFGRSGARHPVLPVALGLVIGGSVSNLADRVRLGYVTDFLDFRYWPAFNLADSFIVIGVAILLAALVLAEREPRGRREDEAPPRR
jgi:signal peptidase II